MRVWVVVYNPTEVEELIIVNIDNLEELNIKEHVKNVQNSPDVETPETAGQASCLLMRLLVRMEYWYHLYGLRFCASTCILIAGTR